MQGEKITLITISKRDGHTILDFTKEGGEFLKADEFNYLVSLADKIETRLRRKIMRKGKQNDRNGQEAI